jgi:predicted nucleic-acid-binding Zn-ribbon protein
MNGFEAICPKCGGHHYGWALSAERYRLCGKCGNALEVKKDGVLVAAGSSTVANGESKEKHPRLR